MPKNLRFIVLMLACLVLTACIKEGDFDELGHPLELSGDFDPIFGVPIAKMSADMGTIVNMVDSTGKMAVDVNGEGIVALHLYDTMRAHLNWHVQKGGMAAARKGPDDTILTQSFIKGTQSTSLFSKLQNLDVEGLTFDAVNTNVTADIQVFISNTFQHLVNRGIRITFDSIRLYVECSDGYSEELNTLVRDRVFDVPQLEAGQHIEIIANDDMKRFMTHKPLFVRYSIRMNTAIPTDEWTARDTNINLDSIGVDSVVAGIYTSLNIPLALACTGFGVNDTVALDLAELESSLDEVRNYVTLDDNDKSYLAFVIDNYLPVEVGFDATLLDATGNPICGSILGGDTMLAGAPIVAMGDGRRYVSDGSTQSTIKVLLTNSLLENLSKTRKIVFSVRLRTSENGQTVAIRPEDKLNVRAYIKVNPHASVHVPIGK